MKTPLERLKDIRDELIQTANRHPAARRDLRDIEVWVEEVRREAEVALLKAALLDEVNAALDDGRFFIPNRDPGRSGAEALVDKIRAIYRPRAGKET